MITSIINRLFSSENERVTAKQTHYFVGKWKFTLIFKLAASRHLCILERHRFASRLLLFVYLYEKFTKIDYLQQLHLAKYGMSRIDLVFFFTMRFIFVTYTDLVFYTSNQLTTVRIICHYM